MYIKLIDLKDEMVREGVTMIDLLELNLEVNYFANDLRVDRIVLVEERHLCRPDLIVWENYRNLDCLDAFLKFNQITNPFSMQLLDVIIIFNKASMDRAYIKSARASNLVKDTKALFLDPTRASQKDISRLKQLAKLAAKRKNGSVQPKPTNLLRPGEVPFATDGNRLIFAPSVSIPRFTSSNDLSSNSDTL
jgi:hypothetical protein